MRHSSNMIVIPYFMRRLYLIRVPIVLNAIKAIETICQLIVLLIMAVFSMITAVLSKNLINNVFISLNMSFLYATIIFAVPLYLVNSSISILHTYLNVKFYTRFANKVKLNFFDRLQRAPYSSLCRLGANDVYYRLFQDTSVMTGYYYSLVISAPVNILSSFTIILVLYLWSPVLTAYIVTFTFFQIGVVLLFRRPLRKSFSDLRSNEQEIAAEIGMHFQIIDSIKIFGLEIYSYKEFSKKYGILKKVLKKNSVLTSLYSTIVTLLNQFWLLGLIVLGAKLSAARQIELGTFMGIYMLSNSLYSPLSSIVDVFLRFEEVKVSYDRYIEYYSKYRNEEYMGDKPFIMEHKLTFSNLKFYYAPESVIIDNFSYAFPKDAFILVKGESGAGKTTFAKLLSRLLYPSSGKIAIDNTDLSDIEYTSLRSGICFLTQKPIIMADTILKNVFLSKPVDTNRFWEVIDSVGLKSVIERMPQKEHTYLGYKGIELSEGEKQRVSLARSLIQNPSILILDEPTSSLDDKNKLIIARTIVDYQSDNNCLLFVISHDSIFDEYADFIMSLEQGRVSIKPRNI